MAKGRRQTGLFVVVALVLVVLLKVEAVDIPSTSIDANNWAYFTLDLATAPTTNRARAIIYFTLSGGTSNVQLYAQYNTQPTTTSNIGFNQSDSADGKYFGALFLTQTTGSLIFGVLNGGSTGVTIANGRYYFAEEQDLPDPFTPTSTDFTIKAGTASIFVLNVFEATSLALSFSLKFTDLTAFQSEVDNLLLRLDAIPNIVDADKWGVIDYDADSGVNEQNKKVAGWEGWFRKGIVSGNYYIPLYNSDSVDHVVTVRAYLTQIFELHSGVPVKVTAAAQKKIVMTYLTDPSTKNNKLQAIAATPNGATPFLQIQKTVCPTTKTFLAWESTRTATSGVTYTTSSTPVTSYCLVVLNTGSSGSYDVTVTVSQRSSSNTGGGTGVTVTNDEYGDGVESIEVAGIVMGTFIGIFSLIFVAWFLLILLQADRDAWFNADPLTSSASSDNQL